MSHSRFQVLAVLVFVGLGLLAGCGDDAAEPVGTTFVTTTAITDTTPATAGPTTTMASSTTEQTSTTLFTATEPLSESELPGTAFGLAPASGAVLSVVGVRYDDVLNLRYAPGTDQPVVAGLAPVAEDFVATGRARTLTQSIWWEVITADGSYGWLSARFTARRGPTFDVTSEVIVELGATPMAESMLELGQIVADALKPDDPDVPTRVVPVVAPSAGDLGEVTFDVVGLADDSVWALRIHVFGQPDEDGEGFALKSVEATDMCDSIRGGTGTIDELCP